ncbi:uncharacterized protein LOC144665192 isoform X1 [Oculina patagonica]
MVFLKRECLLLLLWCCLAFAGVKGVERGKLQIDHVGVDGFHCEPVSFSSGFSSGTPVRVFASINHGNESSGVHDSAFIWVEDVTTSSFKACLVQGGEGYAGNTTIDWFAFQGYQSGVYHGAASFSLFTTETKCNQVAFPQIFAEVPKVHLTVQHGTPNKKKDAMSVWIESVSTSHFEVCLRESRTFDGAHSNLAVNCMAYERYPSVWDAKESSEIIFSENEVLTAQNNYAVCKNVSFSSPFYAPPVVLTTVLNGGSNNTNIACPIKGPLSSWLEEVTKTHFRVCVKDDAGYDGQRSNVTVDYLVIGDLDPCTNAICKYHSHGVALSPHRCTCVCENSCPSYEEQVCASNGRTFRNFCLLKQEICRTRGNYTNYHPGSCTGFPLQKGRHKFQNVPSWAEDQCEVIKFEPFIFYPHKKIYIQLTVNHMNYSDATFVHEATSPWVESVNSTQFTACVTRAGRNDYPSDSFATIDWVAYQGAPSGGVAGEKMFSRWWTGTSCQTVTLPNGKFSNPPTIFTTAEHHRSRLKHDATSVWLEDVSSSSFKICLRELQNFAGVHDDISVNWLAFESLHRPLFKEHRDISFPNNVLPSKRFNFAFCQDVSFVRAYNKSPTVLLTAKHFTGGGNAAEVCNGIVSWIEYITKNGFRVCTKELFVQRFDPMTVSYAVLSDVCDENWRYFKGYCFRKVGSCDSWSGSQSTCATLGANLPSIHSQEENVFVQSLHGGEQSWLGFSDINTEGTFSWSDGTPSDFHYWAQKQPNNFRNQDCVHTLGFLKDRHYEWNDINCTDCHRFTCKKDYNECDEFIHDCPVNATCVNSDGSYSCQCPVGYRLNGNNCLDVDECSASIPVCDVNADCENTRGSYRCSCKAGFTGNGKTCTDIDECKSSVPVCHVNATCQNTLGSYRCSCKAGLVGYGNNCLEFVEVKVNSTCAHSLVINTNATGIIRPRQYSYYIDNMNCQWNFTSNVKLELVFLHFKTDSPADYVNVYDGGSPASPLIGTFSGSSFPSPIMSSSNNLFVTFTTDGSGTSDGFTATYQAITEGTIRLNGSKPSTGRVEIFHNDQWGTICDHDWDINEANVVCKQLGFPKASRAHSGATHGPGSGPIWLGGVTCSGNESYIGACSHRGWENHDCIHSQDASVTCSSVRLANGNASYGRVEVCVNGIWGTVCDDIWDMNHADVVCYQLGFSSAFSAHHGAAYGQGSDPVWMDDVNCEGGEPSLFNCTHLGWGVNNCVHSEDASVVCNT